MALFDPLQHTSDLRVDWQYCPIQEQTVMVKVDGAGAVRHCCLAVCGCKRVGETVRLHDKSLKCLLPEGKP